MLTLYPEGIVDEYALRDITKPLGISEFNHLEKLPEQLIRHTADYRRDRSGADEATGTISQSAGAGLKIGILGGIVDFTHTGRREDDHPRSSGRRAVVKERQRHRVGASSR